MPKLSIITINLNNKEGLQKSMASVLCQTFTDYEYIIIDGGSKDGSIHIIKENSDKLAYWVSESDKGIYNAMNKGIAQAEGEFVLFLNSGDYLYNAEVLSNMLYEDCELIDVLYGDLARTFPDGTNDIVKMPETITSTFLFNASLAHPTTFIRRTLFQKYGLYDESYKIAADHAFFIKIFLKGNVNQKHKAVVVSNFMMDGACSKPGNFILGLDEREKALIEQLPPEYIRLVKEHSRIYRLYNKFRVEKVVQLIKKIVEIESGLKDFFKNVFNLIFKNYLIFKIINPYKFSIYDIPIIINNRNRISYLQKLINSLKKRGYNNIQIIDNNSDYPPLLEFYKTTSLNVHQLGKNTGFCALWDSGLFEASFKDTFYVYTDSDVELVEECPANFIDFMLFNLWRHKKLNKIGLSIKINDLPDHFDKKEEVQKFESFHWRRKIDKNLFDADVDTTFALYRPNKFGPAGYIKALRLRPPYSIYHLPWYENSKKPDEESIYYRNHSETRTHWTNFEPDKFKM
jgi:glycosyltransferase involved in cell wall biosynthesis